ncbi:hypothetical protein EVAR_51807_1 [Eumeta japonica]|uniref:Uncharacterized protein n=1 Tax=Eumeta variegata TaxID=151549 RepID=A0A4C1XX68_EUMVA|nr:hypothetical protein EVAR_51807_1 [Eumeta japonica]
MYSVFRNCARIGLIAKLTHRRRPRPRRGTVVQTHAPVKAHRSPHAPTKEYGRGLAYRTLCTHCVRLSARIVGGFYVSANRAPYPKVVNHLSLLLILRRLSARPSGLTFERQ